MKTVEVKAANDLSLIFIIITLLSITPCLFAQGETTGSISAFKFVIPIILIGIVAGLGIITRKRPFEFIKGANTLTVRRSDFSRICLFAMSAITASFPWIFSYQNSSPSGSLEGVFCLLWTLAALFPGIRAYTECEIKLDSNRGMVFKNNKVLINYFDILSIHMREREIKDEGSSTFYYVLSIQTKTRRMHNMFILFNHDIAEEIIVKMRRFISSGR
ncbi:MAG: hypothetical protein HQ568_02890 [Calditrichaeota bacterium]|nr:hypothetical protein [Calditrichota bacterium]